MHLRNAPTKLMKQLDYGKGYRYAHDEEGGFAAGESYLPDGLDAPALLPARRARPRNPHRRKAARTASPATAATLIEADRYCLPLRQSAKHLVTVRQRENPGVSAHRFGECA